MAALLAVAGLALTLTRRADDTLDRGELEGQLERDLEQGARTESVVRVRCALVDTGVAALAEFRDFDCMATFANGARSSLGVPAVGDEWTITRP